jgi:RNA-directed DNA polymerase
MFRGLLPETFTFLGFTHYCGKRRSNGSFIVWRKTVTKRMVAKLHAIKAELIRRRHDPSAQVGEWLKKVVQGYYQYHAAPGNMSQLKIFRHRLCRLWRAILNRRSQRAEVNWQRLTPLLGRGIPFPRVLHPYPQARFAATHPK